MALLGGATVTLTSRSSGGSPAGPTPPAGAQLAAGGALVLDIMGRQSHGHQVQLTADEVVAIRNRQRVQKDSSLNLNHEHQVTFN